MGHIFRPYLWIGLSFSQIHTAHWGLMPPSCLGDFTQALYLLFFYRPGNLLGDTRVCENWSPSKKGLPLRHSRWVRLGRWTERGSRQDAFHSAAEVPSLSRKVEGVGTRMELWNTRREAAPGLPWLGAQPQWVTILVDLREAKVSLSGV